MPNWCDTYLTIWHEDKEKLNTFHNQICNWLQESSNDDHWLGNLLIKSEIVKSKEDIESSGISCRGYVNDIYHIGNIMTIIQEDAWSPNAKVWQKILDKCLPDAKIYVTGIEPGNGIFESTDPNVIGTFVVDYFSNNENDEKYKDFIELYQSYDNRFKEEDFVIRLAKTIEPCETIDQAINIINKTGCITCDQIEEVDFDNLY